MGFDCFIRFEGIEGESSDDKHQGWIEVLNYDTGLSQTVSSTASSAGGASAERVNFQNFSFEKELDKATPKLALACADGTHIDNIVIELCRAGSDKVKFMEYKLINCIISKVSTESGMAFPFEKVSINFGKIEWSYTQQKRAGGGAAGQVVSGWDLQRNCKV
ncbi:MAG: type VI secretion system tube protein Hcp [Bacteroidetes bacterium]|nr:type VI secretion system tube protein Hcp [Bacteroidota bacterium]